MRFSIITPTYNRAHTLERTYLSLCAQTFRDFEWIVVDDSSTDGTRELVTSWTVKDARGYWVSRDAGFELDYFYNYPNRGLHGSLNFGTKLASGELVTQLDSDDYCTPDAFETFDRRWRELPNPQRFAQIVARCRREDGSLLGSPQAGVIDTSELRDALALVDDDRWGVTRRDIAAAFPYPEFPGEKYITPGIVHNRILRKFSSRYVPDALKIVCREPGHMSSKDWRGSSPKGAALYHAELAMHPVPLAMRLKSAINAVRFGALALVR